MQADYWRASIYFHGDGVKDFRGGGETTQKSSVKSSVKIIEVIRDNNAVAAVELSQHLGLTLRAVEKQLAKMKREGVLRRVGPDKGGYWEVVSNPA